MNEEWNIQRRVPESNKTYQVERKRTSEADDYRRVLGRTSLRMYEREMLNKDAILEQIAIDASELEDLGEGKEEYRSYLEERIQRRQETIRQMDVEKAVYLRKDLQNFFIDLIGVIDRHDIYQDKLEVIFPEVTHMLVDEEVQVELRRVFGDDLSKLSALDLFMKTSDKSLSDECLYRMAKRHDERVGEQEEQLAIFAERTKKEFKDIVADLVTSGVLPEEARNALPRIDQVVVKLKDLLTNMKTLALADIASNSGIITVNSFQMRPEELPLLRASLFHEFLHELSGKSISIKTEVLDESNKIITHQKVGVALRPEFAEYTPNKWLNEAITEWLATRMSGYVDTNERAYKGSRSYTEERRELDRLFSLGLEEKVAIQAFFENFSSEQPRQELGRHYKALVRRIKELEGQEGFLKLDNLHMMNEVQEFLSGASVYSTEIIPLPSELPAETKVFFIHVRMGGAEKVRVERDFAYVVRPIQLDSLSISIEEQWAHTKEAVEALPYRFGPNKISYSIEERLAA